MSSKPFTQTIDDRTIFAAFALHKLLAGVEDPEEHFSQLEDSYSDVCKQSWRIADRMMQVDSNDRAAHRAGNFNGSEVNPGG